jgi:long-chain acyl-CoA synthetase
LNKIWITHYAPGVPAEINADQYVSIPAALAAYCKTYADPRAFVNFGSAITYQELAELSLNLAAYFQQQLQLRPGERIALMMPNILQYPVALFAALRAGLVVVNVNPLCTAAELKRELIDAGAAAIVVLANFANRVVEVLPEVNLPHVMVTQMGDLFGNVKGVLFNLTLKFSGMVPQWRIKGYHDFKQALQQGRRLVFHPPSIQPQDIAFLQYTGGTTGAPKGAMLTHRNILANIAQCPAWIQGKLTLGQEVLLAALPLYHIFALMVSGLTFLALGGECVLITNPRDIRRLIRTWRKSAPTCFIGLNTLFLHLLQDPQFAQLNFQRLKLTVGGGMATQQTVAHAWQQLTGCVITEGYGLTEASPVVAINPLNRETFKSSVGLPIPSTEVKVCDDAGQELPIDTIGELWVKGPQVMQGYWQNST